MTNNRVVLQRRRLVKDEGGTGRGRGGASRNEGLVSGKPAARACMINTKLVDVYIVSDAAN